MPKTQKWCFFNIFLRKLRDKTPTKKVARKTKRYSSEKIAGEEIFLISNSKAPKEAGIKRQKEKLKASSIVRPKSKAIKIVAPERETPGKIAKA